ncbi:RNA polymerase sigma factor SigM [Mariniflexile rhizosphaerae]|uniref:sigma-70 family RNA polymerase sigma factor n=1 Tax=unclassified Mariniflexile TaxID=2643887 RepID=UPI000CC74B87|nr:sigma-70 family RNA polymerase sigma factor [Mariniflexile sp. TRM1-10]AXP81851.1 RNA polymerase sigma factor SigM [Mariniflexile sp. TRM1-10]PLB20764.1 MAG: RNA polymerase sigma factor SigZ [Flavobacteriaceae bacterium FS1-H7996/R]
MQTQDIWNTYSNDIKHFILSKVKDVVVTDDLLQETFIKVHTKLDTLKDSNKLKSWLFAIARYTVLDYFRNNNITYEMSEADMVFDDQKLEHTKEDCLKGIIKSLPKKYRDPLFLSDIKGIKQAQISEQLHLPLPTIKSQIQRGRKLIAQGFIVCCDFKVNDAGYLVGEIKEKEDCKMCH